MGVLAGSKVLYAEDKEKSEDDNIKQQTTDTEIMKEKEKRKRKLIKESTELEKRGVCYLSRIPPHMTPLKLRQLLSEYGEILRIYLVPEDPTSRTHRKRAGGNQGVEFTEGWVEFAKKSVAKRIAGMLNGEQIGGKRRSSHYYDIWNIKYLRKFKWDDLTGELALKRAVREQKLAMEVSAAKKERDFYLSKVEQSQAIKSTEKRVKKKQKLEAGAISASDNMKTDADLPKPLRYFPQKKPVADKVAECTPRLSKDLLKEVFGGVAS
eukprot:TRINITY_DN2690_c0_g1_i4.p1 TRINITY_DN2690_c0_g1~~TRINITY_DN2690_c0_g1_i4.p1  ORF type:complete len:266 (+),score=76.24 TRINITY_DN2690_c0_g1_i4:239-1036(+)